MKLPKVFVWIICLGLINSCSKVAQFIGSKTVETENKSVPQFSQKAQVVQEGLPVAQSQEDSDPMTAVEASYLKFPLGSKENPVRCFMPSGERAYLSRLRCPDGSAPNFKRKGSFGAGPYGNIIDGYLVRCLSESTEISKIIFMDMYHKNYVENQAIEGFTITAPLSAEQQE